jgi:hypothetical protein
VLYRPVTSLAEVQDVQDVESSTREGTAEVTLSRFRANLSQRIYCQCVCQSDSTSFYVQPEQAGGDGSRPQTNASDSSQKRSFKPKKTFDFDNGDTALSEVSSARGIQACPSSFVE